MSHHTLLCRSTLEILHFIQYLTVILCNYCHSMFTSCLQNLIEGHSRWPSPLPLLSPLPLSLPLPLPIPPPLTCSDPWTLTLHSTKSSNQEESTPYWFLYEDFYLLFFTNSIQLARGSHCTALTTLHCTGTFRQRESTSSSSSTSIPPFSTGRTIPQSQSVQTARTDSSRVGPRSPSHVTKSEWLL